MNFTLLPFNEHSLNDLGYPWFLTTFELILSDGLLDHIESKNSEFVTLWSIFRAKTPKIISKSIFLDFLLELNQIDYDESENHGIDTLESFIWAPGPQSYHMVHKIFLRNSHCNLLSTTSNTT